MSQVRILIPLCWLLPYKQIGINILAYKLRFWKLCLHFIFQTWYLLFLGTVFGFHYLWSFCYRLCFYLPAVAAGGISNTEGWSEGEAGTLTLNVSYYFITTYLSYSIPISLKLKYTWFISIFLISKIKW